LSERNIWNDFRETGFIREIEVRGLNAFVQFDTEGDAHRALEDMNGRRLHTSRLRVELVPDRQLNQPNLHLPLTLVTGTESVNEQANE
jgi:RNA recognition motif-containing protein